MHFLERILDGAAEWDQHLFAFDVPVGTLLNFRSRAPVLLILLAINCNYVTGRLEVTGQHGANHNH